MRIRRSDLHITCHRNGRTTVTVGPRLFDAEKVSLQANDGKVIAVKPSCNLFTLPTTLNLKAEPNGELYSLATVVKKLKRQRKVVEAFLKHRRIGRKFGDDRLFTDADVWTIGHDMSKAISRK